MKDSADRISILSQQPDEEDDKVGAVADQLTSELSELKKAQQALKKAMQRNNSEINKLLQEQQKQLVESMPPVPSLTDQVFVRQRSLYAPQEEIHSPRAEAMEDSIPSSNPPKRSVEYDSSDSD